MTHLTRNPRLPWVHQILPNSTLLIRVQILIIHPILQTIMSIQSTHPLNNLHPSLKLRWIPERVQLALPMIEIIIPIAMVERLGLRHSSKKITNQTSVPETYDQNLIHPRLTSQLNQIIIVPLLQSYPPPHHVRPALSRLGFFFFLSL